MASFRDSSRTRWIAYETYTDAKDSSMERGRALAEGPDDLQAGSVVIDYTVQTDRPRHSFPIMYFVNG